MPKSAKQCHEIREQTRETILSKSMLYFARNGFAGTKMSDLSRYIGIGQGTIYVYFDSKEALYEAIRERVRSDKDVHEIKLLSALPLPAKKKIHKLSETVLGRLEKEEAYAGMIALNTQMLLEQDKAYASGATTYQSELYLYTAKIIEQGQREGSMADGNPMMLADYFWGVVYLYALKKLFTSRYELIGADDLSRTVLDGKGHS